MILLDTFFRQLLCWDISVVKVDTNMFVLHFQIATDGRICNNLFVVVFDARLLQLVAVEHGVLSDVL